MPSSVAVVAEYQLSFGCHIVIMAFLTYSSSGAFDQAPVNLRVNVR
jgi:hypothetical protein